MKDEIITKSVWGDIAPNRDGGPGRVTECRSCFAPILWVVKDNGKKIPVDAKTDTNHFKTCPHANQHSGSNPNRTHGPPPNGQSAPAGPVWTGAIELDDADDPSWYVVRVKCSTGDKLKVGDQVKLMRRAK